MGALIDDEIFVITVNNTDRLPVLDTIADQSVSENSAISTVNARDANTLSDTDPDGEVITYTCFWDNSSGETVANTNSCTTLPGTATFTASTGVLDWTPNYSTNSPVQREN